MTFDYKKYSLENLEKWVEDAINSSEASPQEIYNVIKNVVKDNYYSYKNHTERCYELLALLNGNGQVHVEICDNLFCDKDDPSPECKKSWNDFWEETYYPEEYTGSTVSSVNQKKDKVVKWRLPVELVKDEDTDKDEYCVTFPDDLLEAANLKEGDAIEWVDQGNGSYLLKKLNG